MRPASETPFKWPFAGVPLNAGLVALLIFGDLDQYCDDILYFCDFSGGGSGPRITPDLPCFSKVRPHCHHLSGQFDL